MVRRICFSGRHIARSKAAAASANWSAQRRLWKTAAGDDKSAHLHVGFSARLYHHVSGSRCYLVFSSFCSAMTMFSERLRRSLAGLLIVVGGCWLVYAAQNSPSPIRFSFQSIPFHLENDETPMRHVPAAMGGGVAIFDYNKDGRPDIFFANGANIATLQKDSPKYSNRLFRNDGNGKFTDVTKQAGLEGTGTTSASP